MAKLYICGVCGRPIIGEKTGTCPFCGAHEQYLSESIDSKVKWHCNVCGKEFDGEPSLEKCPICGASAEHLTKSDEKSETDNFKIDLSEKDKALAQKALGVEVSNSTFYFCAAAKSDRASERALFQALGEVEKQHAVIWQKILGLPEMPTSGDTCEISSLDNLKESHRRENIAIKFYDQADDDSDSEKLRFIFKALVEIETDHLTMGQEHIIKIENDQQN